MHDTKVWMVYKEEAGFSTPLSGCLSRSEAEAEAEAMSYQYPNAISVRVKQVSFSELPQWLQEELA